MTDNESITYIYAFKKKQLPTVSYVGIKRVSKGLDVQLCFYREAFRLI